MGCRINQRFLNYMKFSVFMAQENEQKYIILQE